jgi:hypothetical protein
MMKVKDIVKYFCLRPMTISQLIIKVENLLQRNEDLAKRVSAEESHLIEVRMKKYLFCG